MKTKKREHAVTAVAAGQVMVSRSLWSPRNLLLADQMAGFKKRMMQNSISLVSEIKPQVLWPAWSDTIDRNGMVFKQLDG